MNVFDVLIDGWLSEYAQYLVSPGFVNMYCRLILMIALLAGLWFIVRVVSINLKMSKMTRQLMAPLTEDSIRSVPVMFNVFAPDWNEFVESFEYDEPNGRYFRTEEPDMFFRFDNMVPRVLMKRLYDALPSFLTGFGILGTFLGLSGGIYLAQSRIAQADITQVRIGLQSLLSGASLAFLTFGHRHRNVPALYNHPHRRIQIHFLKNCGFQHDNQAGHHQADTGAVRHEPSGINASNDWPGNGPGSG